MATKNNNTNSSTKSTRVSAVKLREQIKSLEEALEKEKTKLKDSAYCYLCDTHKLKSKFYINTDPILQDHIGVTPICKECARKIALRVDKDGHEHEATKESVQLALKYLNKPFINVVWDASIQEADNLISGKVKTSVWTAYIKNIQMVQYVGLTYFDSDFYKEKVLYEDEKTTEQIVEEHSGLDTYDDFLKNKKDVIRLLNYDPFENEAISDQPFLYSQLLGLIDSNANENEDMMRNASCIAIVRGFLQQSKIDNSIAKLMSDISSIEKNSATIKSLQDSKSKITTVITNLAAESCISLKNNKNAKKGENTWTGKIKKIKDLDLRQGRVNGFDIETSKAMRQVMNNSHHSILQELKLDDSDWSDMVAEQRELIVQLQSQLDRYTEIARILLNENLDLKDYLIKNNITLSDINLVDLEELYAPFMIEEGDDNQT